MDKQFEQIASLKRPSLMIRAARFGIEEYKRKRDLRRVLKCSETPKSELALNLLLSAEAKLEEARLTRDAAYSVARHVDVLICLMAETEALLRKQPARGNPVFVQAACL